MKRIKLVFDVPVKKTNKLKSLKTIFDFDIVKHKPEFFK